MSLGPITMDIKYETNNKLQFLRTTSDWEAFFYKFYELEIYPGALSFKP